MPILTESEQRIVAALEVVLHGIELNSRVRIYDALLLHARRAQADADEELAGWLGLMPDRLPQETPE